MKLKKNRDYDLERLRTTLTFLGLLFASAVTLTMLEWRVPEKQVHNNPYEHPDPLIDEVVFAAIPERAKPRPKPKPTRVIDVVQLIDDRDTRDAIPILVVPDIDYPDVIEIEKTIEKVTEQEVLAPDVYPEFPGGLDAMHAYLRSELNYPGMARQTNIQGTVWIEFLVDKQGQISEVKVVRGIGGGCDKEALRVVLQMPQWTPGKQHGHLVNVRYHLPISFVLKN